MAERSVLVLMGGTSAEHEVSVQSATQIVAHLDPKKYRVSSILITRNGQWQFSEGPDATLDIQAAISKLTRQKPHCVFIAMHGPFGEDGRIQGMLDLLGIAYTGSGCAASALAMDKDRANDVLAHAGIRVPKHLVFDRSDWENDPKSVCRAVAQEIGVPCVVKAPRMGSSLGMAIPRNAEDFPDAVAQALSLSDAFMVEAFLDGPEFTCGVLDTNADADPIALPVTEIRPVTSDYFDYEAKYTPGASEEITPAHIANTLRNDIQRIALDAHRRLGCRGMSRSDFIVSDGEAYFIELNTIPGFTPTSLLPQGAAAAGISFSELLDRLVENAVAK